MTDEELAAIRAAAEDGSDMELITLDGAGQPSYTQILYTPESDALRRMLAALAAVTAERDRLAAALDALTAQEPLVPIPGTDMVICVYCWYSAEARPGGQPHSPDCAGARARETRGG